MVFLRFFGTKLPLTSRRLYAVADFLLLMFTNIPKVERKNFFLKKKCNH